MNQYYPECASLYIHKTFAYREEELWNFAISGAFINELIQMEQPLSGKWWVQ